MQQVLANCEDRMKKSVSALETDYLALRTGRASAAIFDKVRVDYYGQETPLNQVASISVPEARLVVIQPWDKSLLSPLRTFWTRFRSLQAVKALSQISNLS